MEERAPGNPSPRPPCKLVFLHIPKTAGQSVHAYLQGGFSAAEIAPSRMNNMLIGMTLDEIRRYRLFSGHLDWALLDGIEPPKFVFTILREPRDRILSFYFFLRAKAGRMPPGELELPQHQGMKAALELPCDEYFCGGKPHLRTFLDNHYDNFYAYYFAGRMFDGRSRILGRRQVDPSFNDDRVVDAALSNMTHLDGVYTVDDLGALERDLKARAGLSRAGKPLANYKVNVGDSDSAGKRVEQLQRLGATERTMSRLDAMVRLDNEIWRAVLEQGGGRFSRK